MSDYLTKKTYQIKGSEVAKALNISRASLMNTSRYSQDFKLYLEGVNSSLAAEKDSKLKNTNGSSRGSIRNSKDELVRAITRLRKRVTELEAQKLEEVVALTFDQLPLPIKRKLGID